MNILQRYWTFYKDNKHFTKKMNILQRKWTFYKENMVLSKLSNKIGLKKLNPRSLNLIDRPRPS